MRLMVTFRCDNFTERDFCCTFAALNIDASAGGICRRLFFHQVRK